MTVLVTTSGTIFPLESPSSAAVCVADIASGLSRTVRYVGHTRTETPYSVAEHSVLVSQLCRSEDHARWGLLHDAAETYIGDIPTPVKNLFPEIRDLESKILKAVADRYDLPWPVPPAVHDADMAAAYLEMRDYMPQFPGTERPSYPGPEIAARKLQDPLSWSESRRLFLRQFYQLFPAERNMSPFS